MIKEIKFFFLNKIINELQLSVFKNISDGKHATDQELTLLHSATRKR